MDKSILITGSSSGIGYETAHYLRDRGWRVFASCRSDTDCERLKDEGFEAPKLDYQSPSSISECAREVLDATDGKLGALYNNGAYATPGLVEDLPVQALRENFEANFFGLHDLTRQIIPAFRKNGTGRIINCSSILGMVPMQWRGAYVSSKYALEGLTDVLRLEMRGSGIHVILIEPGPITSDIRKNSVRHFERWIDVENAARAADYERLKTRLYTPQPKDRFELPAETVAKKIHHALTSNRPKPRYFVTTPTWIGVALKRVTTTRMMDRLLG